MNFYFVEVKDNVSVRIKSIDVENHTKMKRTKEENGAEIQPKRKKKNLQAELFLIKNLKETENLFHSNLFKLQIEELMKEIHLSENKKDAIVEWCQSLNDLLYNLKESAEFSVADRVWMNNMKIQMPISEELMENKGVWKFIPPTEIKIIGSFPLDLTARRNCEIDLCIEMPKACFKKSDYLNRRYHQKRALYLAYIAGNLKNSHLIESVCYREDNGDSPTLVLKPSDSESPPTPLYNSSVLQDVTCFSSHEFITSNLESNKKIKDGITLLKIWIHQRGLGEGKGSFNGFVLTMFVLYLLKMHRISAMMSYYQVIRKTWVALAGNEWEDLGITLDLENNGPGLTHFLNQFEVIFVDPSGYLNICAEMRKETLLRVKQEAKQALMYLDTNMNNSFDYLFIQPVIYSHAFDAIIRINKLDQFKKAGKVKEDDNELLDRCGNFYPIAVKKILQIMYKALGSRISSIDVKLVEDNTWDVGTSLSSLNYKNDHVTFGLCVNVERYSDILDKGPSGNSPEVKDFRQFWGSIAELRRFQDGSIHEAVVWPGNSISEKRNVIQHILKHCLSRHTSISADNMLYISNQLDCAISLNRVSLPANIKAYGTGEEVNIALLQSYDSLNLSLRKLKDLPLAITSIQGISSAFRFSQIYPPMPSQQCDEKSVAAITFDGENLKVPRHVDALEVIITLESSGKWPDDLEALLHVKAAFQLKFAKLLKEQCFLKTLATPDYTDVYKDGYVFRLIVSCQKEIVLRKTTANPDGMKVLRDNPESLLLEHQIITLPKLTSSIHGLVKDNKQFSGFSSAVRLAKRWISCQMLSDEIPEVATELIMAHLFLQPAPYSVPNVPMVAFQRYLHFLSHHNWNKIPLIVNLNDEFTYDDYNEIQKNFDNCRSNLPIMFIACPLDKHSHFTKKAPSVPILQRLILLAKESLQIANSCDKDLMKMFRPSHDSYDALIKLKKNVIAKYQFEVMKLKQDVPIPITEFDPVKNYLDELRDNFNEIALFFYHHDTIGVLFKPSAYTEKDFKVGHKTALK
ncbi:Nucleolar protein 6 [Nymphon striatum]|nr:Nucleolar protein 6 [Nymphon striatum]